MDVQPLQALHQRAKFWHGDAASPQVITQVQDFAAGRRGLVLLDGDHASGQVARELQAYASLADYLVVQDTIMRWLHEYYDGPHEALDAWLPQHPEFAAVDDEPLPTQHPGGWLRRVSD